MRNNGSSASVSMDSGLIFGRQQEMACLRRRLHKGGSLLLHGPTGVGKTLLLRALLPDFPDFLYCGESSTIAGVLRRVAEELFRVGSGTLRSACTPRGMEALQKKSASSRKGIVLDALRAGDYCVVLDHLDRPSPAFAATVRELLGWAGTPVIAVARSAHMEDTGALHSFFADRADRFQLRNFDPAAAGQFARVAAEQAAVTAGNLAEFLERVTEFSAGNPGAILRMVEMATRSQYRSHDRIKIAPLYIDFRLGRERLGYR